MKTTIIKRILTVMFVLALVFTVYTPAAYCTSPSPSTTTTVSPSPSPSTTTTVSSSPSPSPTGSEQPAGSEQPTGSEQPAGSTDPNAPSGFQMIKLNDEGPGVIRVQMRLRALGYFSYRPTGKYFTKTEKAVRDFQTSNQGLDPDGRVGEQTYATLFSTGSVIRKPLSPAVLSAIVSGPVNNSPSVSGELGDWATINTAFAVGSSVTVTDVNKPDITFSMTRTGGTNLAAVEATTTADYNKFKECFGGDTNWEKRSVLVSIGGVNYAASLFGNPSGADTIGDNSMAGHTTLYFYGCTTDVSGFIDKEDLKMVMRAANKPVKFPGEP